MRTTKVECNDCDKKFHVNHSLNVHVRYAHELNQVKYDYCGQTFRKKSNLNTHMEYVHDTWSNKILLDDDYEITYFDCNDFSESVMRRT